MPAIDDNSLQLVLKTLPNKPGIYQYYDEKGEILYIGKAKNLKKRVSSYFTKERSASGRLKLLVRKIARIEHIVVETEFDAFLLENNLIKKYQPRYNIQLKDDKTFPWICVKNEPFPRIFSTRNKVDDGSSYFGPYASVRVMKTLLDLVRQLYPIRTCNLRLTQKNIESGKFKVCLEYHLGNCLGPCEGLQTEEDYDASVADIINIIKGNISSVQTELKERMERYANEFEFEKAQVVKEKIELLAKYQAKSMVVSATIKDVDVFSIIDEEKVAYVNFMKVVNGSVVQGHTVEVKKKLDETADEVLGVAIPNIRTRFESASDEIILPVIPEMTLPDIKYTVPQRGDKKHLLELSERNAKYYKLEKEKQQELVDPERHSKRILETMKKDLRMSQLPERIECFDNSNIQGSEPVAAMVCFINAKPAKKEYRHFNIKTVTGPDDFASMEEIIYRRYSRVLNEEQPLPQLVIVDGGKGQLNAALKSLEKLGLRGKVTVIGIAKRLEEIYYPNDPLPMYLDKKSETLKIIQHLRDEAHRFGITHHRKRMSKATIKTSLTEIKGIGDATANSLLKAFGSVKRIKEATIEELAPVIGKKKAVAVIEYFTGK